MRRKQEVERTIQPEHRLYEIMAPSRIGPQYEAAPDYKNGASLKSKWPAAEDLYGSNQPCRIQGEVADLVVLGDIPPEIDGTFYRVTVDPFMPPHPGNVPIDGDGNITALRFKDGKVDLKLRYVETERFQIERNAGKAMFGLYRNPFSHHPCVRAAVDSTANTNLVLWANKFMALKEGGLPYQVDPHTLDTITYDPFGDQGIKAKTFTAHPVMSYIAQPCFEAWTNQLSRKSTRSARSWWSMDMRPKVSRPRTL